MESRGVWGAARPPNEKDGRGGRYSQWILGDGTISGDGQGWVDIIYLYLNTSPFHILSFETCFICVADYSCLVNFKVGR